MPFELFVRNILQEDAFKIPIWSIFFWQAFWVNNLFVFILPKWHHFGRCTKAKEWIANFRSQWHSFLIILWVRWKPATSWTLEMIKIILEWPNVESLVGKSRKTFKRSHNFDGDHFCALYKIQIFFVRSIKFK